MSRSSLERAALWTLWALTRVHMAALLYRSDLFTYHARLVRGALAPEYGPLASLLVALPAWLGGGPEPLRYVLAAKALALVVDAALFAALMRRASPAAGLLFVASSALLRRVWLDRLDLHVGALVVVFAVARSRGRLGALVGAALIKFPFLALAGVDVLRRRTWRALGPLAAGIGAFAALTALAWLVAGPTGAVTQFAYHAGRTLQIEGLLGNLLHLGAALGALPLVVRVDHGAAHLHGGLADVWLSAAGQLLLGAGVAVTAWRLWRAGDAVPRPLAVLLGAVAYTAFNPVGSPQFAVVLVALAPWTWDAAARVARAALALLVPYALLVDVAFALYPGTDLRVDAAAWTLARNATLLAVWLTLVLAATSRAGRAEPPPRAGAGVATEAGGSAAR